MSEAYDVFISYNALDHVPVERIARLLQDRYDIRPFLDRWYLVPGQPWREKLETIILNCKAVAVCIGPHDMGPWQQREVYLAQERQGRTAGFPLIPVLLPGAEPVLGFLGENTWVDFRGGFEDELSLSILGGAIRGEPPGPDALARIQETAAAVCPFRGLLYFREEDAPFFFGRDAAVAQLREALDRDPLVALVGASGSGKSSVLRAGLSPALRHDRETTWDIVTLVPTDRPFHALAGSLVPLLEPDLNERRLLEEVNGWAESLAAGDIPLRDAIARILAKQTGTRRILLVIDQWEELITLTAEATVRRAFIDKLLEAARHTPLSIVLAVRGDFVGSALLGHRELSDRVQNAQVNLGPLKRQELNEVIAKPAEKTGLEYQSGLQQRIVEAVGDEPGNLPLLEFVLKNLWETRQGRQLTHTAYEAMGELHGAIARRADGVFQRLSAAEQLVARRIFTELVRPGEGAEDTRRRVALEEMGPGARDVVKRLADERLLVTGRLHASAAETVEVAHEALIARWDRLRGWIEEDRVFLSWRERLRGFQSAWEGTDPEEQQRDRAALLGGRLLAEAGEWLDQRPEDLSPTERAYILASRHAWETAQAAERERQEIELAQQKALAEEQSARIAEQARSQKRLRWGLGAALSGLLGATSLGGLAWNERQDALLARDKAGELIHFMIFELRDKLEPIGRLDIVESVNAKVHAYFREFGATGGDVENEHSRAAALFNRGDQLVSQGRLGEAQEAFQAAQAIAGRLVEQDPTSNKGQRDLWVGTIKLGEVLSAQGHYDEALRANREGLAILQKLGKRYANNAQWQRDMAASYDRIGNVLAEQKQAEEALKAYGEGLDLRLKLVSKDKSKADWQRELAISYDKLGDVFIAQFRLDEALKNYQQSQEIRKKLAETDPANVGWQRDLSLSYMNLGDVLAGLNRKDEAYLPLQEAVGIARKLADQDPSNAGKQHDLAVAYYKLGLALKYRGNGVEGLGFLEAAKAIGLNLATLDPANIAWKRELELVNAQIDKLKAANPGTAAEVSAAGGKP